MIAGALVGLVLGLGGLLMLYGTPAARRTPLVDRLAPHLGSPELSRATVGAGTPADPLGPFADRHPVPGSRAVIGWRPVLGVAGGLDRLLGGRRRLERRLAAAGSTGTVEAFRAEQALAGLAGVGCGLLALPAGLLAAVVLAVFGGAFGVLCRDWWLSVRERRRAELLLAELPVLAELLALAVTAGEPLGAALHRVCRLSSGELGRELATTLADARSGTGLTTALERMAARTTLEPLVRFVDGLVIALERGTPLAAVLRAQAADAREARKRALLASGGRREIAMLVPVVFLILPVTVLFALYPGVVSITLLAH